MLGGVKGFGTDGLIPAAVPAACPSRRTSASPLLPSSRSTPFRPLSCPLRSVGSGRLCPPFRYDFPCRVLPRVFDPRRFTVYPPLLPRCTDLLQVCRTIACVHDACVALAAGHVSSAAARPAAPRPTRTLRSLPRHPPQHSAHRRSRPCPPHCRCFCCQLCVTSGVLPFSAD